MTGALDETFSVTKTALASTSLSNSSALDAVASVSVSSLSGSVCQCIAAAPDKLLLHTPLALPVSLAPVFDVSARPAEMSEAGRRGSTLRRRSHGLWRSY